jgi:hypothetical protein
MSNTAISPGAGAISSAGIAASMALGITPIGAALSARGVAPTATSVSPVLPRGGLPADWNALAAGAASSAVGPLGWSQARFTALASSVFGVGGAAQIQVSYDNATWLSVAAITDSVAAGVALPGASFGAFGGVAVSPVAGGVVLSATADQPPPYLRCLIAGGDGSTSIGIAGNVGVGAL